MTHRSDAPPPALRPLAPADSAAAGDIVAANPLWNARYDYPAAKASADVAEALARGDLVIGAYGSAAGTEGGSSGTEGGSSGVEAGLLGFAWVLPRGAFGRFPYLRLLAVSPKAQGSGLGAALLAAAEEPWRKAGERQMLLMVSDFNEGAQRFYRAHGYIQVGSCPDFLREGIAEQVWIKRL